jgi:hypothetical protein
MFSSKKEFSAVEVEIKELKDLMLNVSSKFDKHSKETSQKLSSQDEKIASILDSVNRLQEKTSVFGQKLDEETRKFIEYNDAFRKRIDSLKILEDKISKKLLDDAVAEIKSQVQSLFTTTKEYQKLESDLKLISQSVSSIKPDIDKLHQIAGNLKPADFIMSEFAKRVTQADQEKLNLMRENERLKMIISKERRNKISK